MTVDVRKRRPWVLKRKIGHISLVIAVGGLILSEAGIFFGLLQGQGWRILATGFEAATIGALADWFAVSALFHHIPIPLIGRHTNIIVKNRQKLTEAIVELVTTKWLSSEIIYEKLQGVRISSGVFGMMEKENNQELIMEFLGNLLRRFSENLDNPQMASLFHKLVKDQVMDMDVAPALGAWLEQTVRDKEHVRLVNFFLGEFQKALDDPSSRKLIHEKLRWAMASYGSEDFVKSAALRIGRWTGAIDPDLITARLLEIFKTLVAEVREDRDHALRLKLDRSLLDLAKRLQENNPEILHFIHHLKAGLLEDERAQKIIFESLSRLKVTFTYELAGKETVFMKLLRKNVFRFVREMRQDKAAQDKLDSWLKETFARLVNKYHHEVGNMVRSSLLKLDDKALVWQVKEKVGDDLQYIRLNGAVVGGLAGILIALLKMLLLQ